MGTVESHESNGSTEPEDCETKDDSTLATKSTSSASEFCSSSYGSSFSNNLETPSYARRPQNTIRKMKTHHDLKLKETSTDRSNDIFDKRMQSKPVVRAATPMPNENRRQKNKNFGSNVHSFNNPNATRCIGKTTNTVTYTTNGLESKVSQSHKSNVSPPYNFHQRHSNDFPAPRQASLQHEKQTNYRSPTSSEPFGEPKPANSLLKSDLDNFVAVGSDVRTVEEVNDAIRKITDEESLPAPWYEIEMKVVDYLCKSERISTPMDFQPKLQLSVEDRDHMPTSCDAAYLEKLYKHRTWSMYKLICDARQDRSPNLPFSPSPKNNCNIDSLNESDISSHEMIFDME